MTLKSAVSQNSIQVMFKHLPILREYAKRSIIMEEMLTNAEEQDRLWRLREFIETGSSLNWTEKEVVTLLLKETLTGY